jgi:hypothetical protein
LIDGLSKKRKTVGGTKVAENSKSGTVTGHYFNFISSVLAIMDRPSTLYIFILFFYVWIFENIKVSFYSLLVKFIL